MKFNFHEPLPSAGYFDVSGEADVYEPEVERVFYVDPMGRKADITKMIGEFNGLYGHIQNVALKHCQKVLGEIPEEDYTLQMQ